MSDSWKPVVGLAMPRRPLEFKRDNYFFHS